MLTLIGWDDSEMSGNKWRCVREDSIMQDGY